MLNPLAHDFTPISAFSPEAPSSQQLKSPPPPKRKEDLPKKKQAKPKTATTTTTTTTTTNTSSSPASTSTAKGKKKDSQANPKKQQQQQQHRDAKSKHRTSKTTQNPTALATPSDLFAKESKFITIEAAIDPIRRIKETSHANSLQHRRQSTNTDKYQLEHGYEQYIDWIDRSLRLFDTVTLVGMDNAVVDIVSLVTILQDRRIGVHDDVETFSMDIGSSRITACIQVKLHSFY